MFSVQAAPEYGTVIVSRVISVYDGDTFRVDIDSLPPIVGKNIPIRLRRPTLYPAELRARLVTDNFSRVITFRIKNYMNLQYFI